MSEGEINKEALVQGTVEEMVDSTISKEDEDKDIDNIDSESTNISNNIENGSVKDDCEATVGTSNEIVEKEPDECEQEGERINGNVIPNGDGIDPLCPDYIPILEVMDIEKNSFTRVKLYVLCEQKIWTDKGTGHVAILAHPEEEDLNYIVVRLEQDDRNVLQRKILKDTNYEKQQDTLVVWAEGENINLALSFQEKDGCEQTWANIVKAQGRNPMEVEAELRALEARDNSSLNSSGVNGSSIAGDDIELPPCNLGSLNHFETLLSNSLSTPVQRERMAIAIEESSYIKQLCGIFQLAENMEHTDKLIIFGKIVKGLFMLNRRPIVVEMLDTQYVKDIVGMFEYDCSYGEQKNHREFLWKKSNFKEIIPINNEDVKRLIRRSYILQYILDVCMPPPSMFEDNLTFQATKYQLYIRVKIVCSLIDDKILMKELFTLLQDPIIEEQKRLELMNFLKEFCSLARTLPDYMAQSPAGCDFPSKGKEQFFSTLVEYNFFNIIPVCLKSTISATRSITIELLNYFLENNSKLVRDFMYKDIEDKLSKNDKEGMIINMIISHIFTDKDAELYNANQCLSVIRALVECSLQSHPLVGGFFNHCLPVLCQPLSDNLSNGKIIKENYYIANKMTLIINFFTFCIEQHGPTVIRLNPAISTIIINAGFYIRNLIVKTFEENGPRYNLLNSAILDFYEHIAEEKMTDLITITVEKHFDAFKNIGYVKTFRKILAAYGDQMNSRTTSGSSTDSTSMISMTRNLMNPQWRKEQDMESDEQYFDKDDDELEDSESDETETSDEKNTKVDEFHESISKFSDKCSSDEISPVFSGGAVEPLKGHGITFKFERKIMDKKESNGDEYSEGDEVNNYKISLVKYDDSDEDDYDGPWEGSQKVSSIEKSINEIDDKDESTKENYSETLENESHSKGVNVEISLENNGVSCSSESISLDSESEIKSTIDEVVGVSEESNNIVNENLEKGSSETFRSITPEGQKRRRSDTRDDFLSSINDNDNEDSSENVLETVDEHSSPVKKRCRLDEGDNNTQSDANANPTTSHSASPTATV
ncbi:Serine/threonine-protein phosphatase 4 regulatory subunit 3 [Strongyloides ratti]|uniref:Serine/threonine-protein phosphatase 4 regulatory subunit 3 n=1 Tax=Strongyloides ratti TaxID=34506 RepID=A0A090LKN9_STRRB|nr:Serine/threonine-protein phosphatase 4 regulatory subunit 3 [Strongyloides ratti]CEF70399.1 Serine/threonine-protein phosphatase 4 regulatory subunit 3 [Strongyloides ratti]